MSYEKAMKHHRNIKKCKKQSTMHFGFDSCSKPTKSIWSNPRFRIEKAYNNRHTDSRGLTYIRECIAEYIEDIRLVENKNS